MINFSPTVKVNGKGGFPPIHSQVYQSPLSPDHRMRIAQLNIRVQMGCVQADEALQTTVGPSGQCLSRSHPCAQTVKVSRDGQKLGT